jgi:hypothetical protein
MQAHSGNERSRKIGAHLPVDTDDLAGFRPADKCPQSCFCQLARPADIFIVAGDKSRLTKGMDPFGEIVEILTVPVPLASLVDGFVGTTFPEELANPKATQRWLVVTLFVIEAADPAFANVVTAITSEHSMDLIDQLTCMAPVFLVTSALAQLKEVTDREGVSPKISSRI